MKKSIMIKIRPIVNCIALMLVNLLFSGCDSGQVVLENHFFRYVLSVDGTNLEFTDKTTGRDYLDHDTRTKCAFLSVNGISYEVSKVVFGDSLLRMEFGESGAEAGIQVTAAGDQLTLKVVSLTENVESLTFLNVPLKLEGMPYEPFSACVLSMNLFTHVRQLPPLQTHLWATCYERFGLEGAEITLLGLPREKILPVIREVMTKANDIPFSDEGGACALMKKEGYGSYLMNFGTLTEETVDEWIETCRRMGFTQIDSHGGGDFFEFGTFDLNKDKWPDGWDSFKRINARLHQAGISHIFHTYAFFIDKNSEYVTPVPGKDLGYVRTFTLAEPVDENNYEIVVKESTANISTITGFHTENSVTLRIGDELIRFSEVSKSAPYKFTGLRRGANGTKPSSHAAGEVAYHLSERFGRFVPGPETGLFDEMAQRHAEIVNHCEFDGIYFDAIDGAAVLGGEENFWYYGTKFIFEVAKHLKRPVGMEMSSMSHHWWHYRSRWQAWDRPVRGYKRFIDIHLASIKASAFFLHDEIKSNEWEHGRWRGHSPLIDKYAGIENGQILLPLHLGWWGNQSWNPPQLEPTFFDDIEYLGCKMIGNNAGFSQLGGVDKKTLDDIPLFKRSAEILKQYEELRQQDYFGEEVKRLLRQPGKEFTLFQEEDGEWNFKPVTYQKHKVTGLGHPSSQWTVNNEFGEQPVKLRIELLMSVKTYNDSSNIILADFSNPDDFIRELSAEGIAGRISISEEKTPDGEISGTFSAKNAGKSPQDGSYINLEKTFVPAVNLGRNKALGVWVKGDGNGQVLNLSVRSPMHISHGAHGDRFITIDFTGWKYFELVEIESSKISDYSWPDDSHFYVYDSYRHTVDFNHIEKFQLWYNNLPPGKDVECKIGPVKALPMVPIPLENPEITVNGKKITFPVTMNPGMFLELNSASDCKLYGPKGELLMEVRIDNEVLVLAPGENQISFSGKGTEGINSRAQVTVISEGSSLDIR
ncbi:hypothetical protein [Gaoshiqia sp. Z1-71]|uniref:hypothetical protein n=1 Tax=Gaoshiqia hydrogeniformans TaxID=3290090 RepID=UPI003BF80452